MMDSAAPNGSERAQAEAVLQDLGARRAAPRVLDALLPLEKDVAAS